MMAPSPSRRETILWLLIFALPFFAGLGASSLVDANEAFYTQTPREMLERGDWVVPYFNGETRINKPPLSYWLVAIFFKVFSVSVIWERVPMALLAWSSVVAVFTISRNLGLEPRVALLAAGILATTPRFLLIARRLFIDVLLLACVLWAVAFFLMWLRSSRNGLFLLSAMFFGLGFLAKGPVALAPLVVLGLYVFISGRGRALWQAPWIAAVALVAVICSSWYVALGLRLGWEPVTRFFLYENAARFLDTDFGPHRGPFFYLGPFMADFFPWSLLIPSAVVWTLNRWRSRASETRNDACLLPALWVAFFVVFFSAAHNKIDYYLLPIYPFAAVWAGFYLSRVRTRALLVVIGVLILIPALLITAVGAILLPEAWWWAPLLAIPVIVLGMKQGSERVLIGGLALFYSGYFAFYLTPLEAYRPVRAFASTIQQQPAWRRPERPARAGYYNRIAATSLAFYLNAPIVQVSDPGPAAKQLQSDSPVYLIVHSEDLAGLEAAAGPLQIVEIRPMLRVRAEPLVRALRGQSIEVLRKSWTVPVYLVTNGRT
jgi:4-amino-4-deoxy-L-arabinose transferase-like glycosyltransferase